MQCSCKTSLWSTGAQQASRCGCRELCANLKSSSSKRADYGWQARKAQVQDQKFASCALARASSGNLTFAQELRIEWLNARGELQMLRCFKPALHRCMLKATKLPQPTKRPPAMLRAACKWPSAFWQRSWLPCCEGHTQLPMAKPTQTSSTSPQRISQH